MRREKIRVGIVGTGSWTQYGHLPALQLLDEFEIFAIAGRKKEKAKEIARKFNIPHAFDDEQAIVNHPNIDLVVILTPALDHARLARTVIAARKDVYSEWPLSTTTTESEELLALAEAKGVRHIVGLQRRFGPSARYMRDLVKQGYVGQMRSARMTVSVDAFPPVMPAIYSWSFDVANFANTVSVYVGHFGDVLFNAVGFPEALTAIVKNQYPVITIPETGEKVPTVRPDAVMAIGTLENGSLFSIQIEGAQRHRTGLQIDITGTEGVLRITNARAFENKDDNIVEGVNGDGDTLSPLPVPAEYRPLVNSGLDVSQQDVAYLYSAYARDRNNGTSEASNFKDAVKEHRVIDQMFQTSEAVFV
ncbi:MAG: Gfo/Idh/MocA family oxidoreductase [Gammaproteobacteria bacterium]|nr:Gfo/Idh/MocA family oxidoreductase [Gammaproteobacteria bacterium]